MNFRLVLSLFTVYQWNNGLCSAASGEYGDCLPENECIAKRGIPGGPCAEGHGICCVCMNFVKCSVRIILVIQSNFQLWLHAEKL